MRLIALTLITCLTACTQFPELDSAVSEQAKDAEYPALVPVEGLLAQAETTRTDPDQTIQSLNARVAALRNRAKRLRNTVVDSTTRQRMKDGVTE